MKLTKNKIAIFLFIIIVCVVAYVIWNNNRKVEAVEYSLKNGDAMPNVEIYDIDNNAYKLYDMIGDSTTVIYARVDCPDCKKHFDEYKTFIDEGNAIMLWSRNTTEDELDSLGFTSDSSFFTHGKYYLNDTVPTYFLLDNDGKIICKTNDINDLYEALAD